MLSSFFSVALMIMMHPVHETVAEVQWNPESKCLEVSLRLSVLDEQWILREKSRESVKDIQKQNPSECYLEYLKPRFLLDAKQQTKRKQEDRARYKWIGRSEEGSHAWWHFEIHPSDGTRPEKLENRLLLDRERNYTNRVLVLEKEKPKRALTFSVKHPEAELFPRP